MGVRVFRDNHWIRIKSGAISRRDLLGLDRDLDRELIAYLISHAPESCHASMLKYAMDHYDLKEPHAPLVNADDPTDFRFWDYAVLREQIERETDYEILKAAALQKSEYDLAAFAFFRLTGMKFPSSVSDASSYRTYECGLLPGITEEQINEMIRTMIEERGLFKDVAMECMRDQKADHS